MLPGGLVDAVAFAVALIHPYAPDDPEHQWVPPSAASAEAECIALRHNTTAAATAKPRVERRVDSLSLTRSFPSVASCPVHVIVKRSPEPSPQALHLLVIRAVNLPDPGTGLMGARGTSGRGGGSPESGLRG